VFTRRRKVPEFSIPTLFGKPISRAEQVKHLGVVLDSKLSWKSHIEAKLQKATAIFWQCRRAFGKSWGLSPKIISFMYKSLVLPILSYASIVWCPAVILKASLINFNSLQYFACRVSTGAMSSTPLLALESILYLPQLPTFILGTACSTAFRLKCLGAWNVHGAIVGHRKILRNYSPLIPEIDMVNDRLVTEYNFSNLFAVVYPSKESWTSQFFLNKLSESLVFYSDGSRSALSSGFGIFCPFYNLKSSGNLGPKCTIAQAELTALTHCAITALELDVKDKNIVMCTDSKSVLNSINNPLTVSKLVKDCKFFLNLLCAANRVSVMWVPGHCDIHGNEVADSLAKAGSQLSLIGPKPAIPLTFLEVKKAIRNYGLYDLKRIWLATPSCRKAKNFIKEPNINQTKYALSLKKNQLRVLVAILTGHGRFKDHFHRLGLVQDDICEDCLEESDNCIHFVCDCPAFDNVRTQIFNTRSIDVGQLSSQPWSKLVQFSKAALRFRELG
jgi:ribonuclease HI